MESLTKKRLRLEVDECAGFGSDLLARTGLFRYIYVFKQRFGQD